VAGGGLGSRTSSRRVQLELEREQCVGLRLAGGSLRQIGAQLGISYEKVRRLVGQALDETRARTQEEVERLREQECRRCDAIILALWPTRADPQSARAILQASERRARLLGLDSPLKFDTTTHDEPSATAADMSNLTTEELLQYERLLKKTHGVVVDVTPSSPEEQASLPPSGGNGASGHEAPGNGSAGPEEPSP
jgi:DNA-binding CsgD family transcriptional regulator